MFQSYYLSHKRRIYLHTICLAFRKALWQIAGDFGRAALPSSRRRSSGVERVIGNDEVGSSILLGGTIILFLFNNQLDLRTN